MSPSDCVKLLHVRPRAYKHSFIHVAQPARNEPRRHDDDESKCNCSEPLRRTRCQGEATKSRELFRCTQALPRYRKPAIHSHVTTKRSCASFVLFSHCRGVGLRSILSLTCLSKRGHSCHYKEEESYLKEWNAKTILPSQPEQTIILSALIFSARRTL